MTTNDADEPDAEVEVVVGDGEHEAGDQDATGSEAENLVKEGSSTGALKHIPIEEDVLKKLKVVDL